MSDFQIPDSNDYVNQVTLNLLISKAQLQKLNKKMNKETKDETQCYDKARILELFTKIMNNERPDDLLEDVKMCFDAFIEKCIYYIDVHDKNMIIDQERNQVEEVEEGEVEEEEEEEVVEKVNWFTQNYKINQVFPRKKETII
jgi:hypothetical protein